MVGGTSCGLGICVQGVHLVYACCKIVEGVRGGGPLVYECCKMVGGTSCGLWVGGGELWVTLVYECCKIVGV